jgi:hypothetical protein
MLNLKSVSSNASQNDMVQLLNKKLDQMQLNYEDVNKERDKLREVNESCYNKRIFLFLIFSVFLQVK